jgi:hypothetical protein
MIAVPTGRTVRTVRALHRSRTLPALHAAALAGALALIVPAAHAAPREPGPGQRAPAGEQAGDAIASETARDGASGAVVRGTVQDGDLLNTHTVAGGMAITGLAMVALASASSGTPAFAASTAGAPDAGSAAGAAGVAVTAPGSSGAPVAAVPADVTGDLANGPGDARPTRRCR